MQRFAHITDWVFDLDNTLYPRSCNLFRQIDRLMTQYVVDLTGLDHDAARALKKQLYLEHGTTMNGLMATHNIDPSHYLKTVHDIDYTPVMPHPELVELIARLPGRKFIFTNADAPHAREVLQRLGAVDVFDGIFDIVAAGYRPKPLSPAYEKCLNTFDITPQQAIMFDDMAQNLSVPHAMGMTTVQIMTPSQTDYREAGQDMSSQARPRHIHHATDDLPGFLRGIVSMAA